MTAHRGIFVLSKRGLCFGTIAQVSCQFVSPYFKFIAYKLVLEIIRKEPSSHAAHTESLTKYGHHNRNRFFSGGEINSHQYKSFWNMYNVSEWTTSLSANTVVLVRKCWAVNVGLCLI